MTASERLAEIKAELVEVEVAWGLSLSEIDEVSDTLRSLVAALEAVLAIDPGEPTCAEDVGYYDGIMAARRAINEALEVDQ